MTDLKKYNLKKDVPDSRDFMLKVEKLKIDVTKTPQRYDLRSTKLLPPILDQSNLGSCGPNHISNALRYCLHKEKLSVFQPSRLFIYYFSRLVDNLLLNQDTGITIRGGLKAVQKYGSCSENIWPYIVSKFKEKPPDISITEAKKHINGFKYIRIPQNLINIKQTIFGGFPIICGIMIYTSFESNIVRKTGIVPMPNTQKEKLLGGHCVTIIGYIDSSKVFILANSWGKNWGNMGFFTMPYDYILNNNLTSDFWITTSFK